MEKPKKEYKFKDLTKKERKTFRRFKRLFRYRNEYATNSRMRALCSLELEEESIYKINLRLIQNNVFCTLTKKDSFANEQKVIYNRSSGIYKINISKKTLKFKHKIIVTKFITDVKTYLNTEKLTIVEIKAPIRIRRLVVKQLSSLLKEYHLVIKVQSAKSFNGCRPKKQKRKKQKGLRIFR